MTLYEYSGARTWTKLGAYIKQPKKRKFYTAIVRAQNWIKTGRALRGSGGCVGSALQSWERGRAWGDGTRDLTGINYDTGSRTSAGAYAYRMTWDSDGPHGNRMCSHPGLPLGSAPRWTLQCQGRCVPGKIKLTSNSAETFRAKDLPQLTQWSGQDAGRQSQFGAVTFGVRAARITVIPVMLQLLLHGNLFVLRPHLGEHIK